ncbi:hypothetical protein KEJ49_01795, partial [Candidatus Bathyarchaeota archaeon]|nr:hypothetical protein [Candidatus Bathyarchaeota archaeon]
MGIEIHELFQGVFEILMEDRRLLATINLTPGIGCL